MRNVFLQTGPQALRSFSAKLLTKLLLLLLTADINSSLAANL